MERLGDKTEMKKLAAGTALKPIPGTGVLYDAEEALGEAEKLGIAEFEAKNRNLA